MEGNGCIPSCWLLSFPWRDVFREETERKDAKLELVGSGDGCLDSSLAPKPARRFLLDFFTQRDFIHDLLLRSSGEGVDIEIDAVLELVLSAMLRLLKGGASGRRGSVSFRAFVRRSRLGCG
jgi:hypothetical protein